MKACISALSIALLCLNQVARAQNTLLKVGDKAPQLKAYKWLKGSQTMNFKKGQVYIVDFGATWCVPCAAAIPHLTELAKKFGSKLNVASVFVMEPRRDSTDDSYVQNVITYVKNRDDKMKYNVAVDNPKGSIEKAWLKAAALNGIPQSFVIDKNGMIAWMGNPNDKMLARAVELVQDTSYNINDAIEYSENQKKLKPLEVDTEKPLFIDGNGGDGKDFLYRSILTKYKGESGANWDFVCSRNWSKISPTKQPYAGTVQQIGVSLLKLYYLAYADTIGNTVFSWMVGTQEYPDTVKYPTTRNSYGNYWYKPILQVRDTTPFQFDFKSVENRYNYSLIVPDEKASAQFLQEVMRRDLTTYFGYDVKVEEKIKPYWKLVATDRAKISLRTKTPGNKCKDMDVNDTLYRRTNSTIKDIMTQYIIPVYSFGYTTFGVKPKIEAPFIDETGITNEIDYEFSDREFREMMKGNWDILLNFLHRLGLDLVSSERLTRVIVIRDPKNN